MRGKDRSGYYAWRTRPESARGQLNRRCCTAANFRPIASKHPDPGEPFIDLKKATLLLVGVLAYHPLAVSSAEEGFAERYHAYQGHVQEGLAAINTQDYLRAIEHYTKAIEQAPFVASHYYYRGLARHKLGQAVAAIDDFTKVLLLEPNWLAAYVFRGLSHLSNGEERQAREDYSSALSVNSKDPAIHNNLAWLYATARDEKVNDKSKALEHAKKAAELSKEGNAEILDTLAKAYFINGKLKEALEAEEKAVKLDSHNKAFKEHVQAYEQAMKNFEPRR